MTAHGATENTTRENTEGFRADMIVQGKHLLELNSVESITKARKKRVLT